MPQLSAPDTAVTTSRRVPYQPLEPRDISLPKRQKAWDYREADLALRHIPTPY